MYPLKTHPIDIDREIKEMVKYMATRWENIPSPEALFKAIQSSAARDARFWFVSSDISDIIRVRRDNRETVLTHAFPELEAGLAEVYDKPRQLLTQMSRNIDTVHESGMEVGDYVDFERKAKAVYRRISTVFDVSRARPLGWDELKKSDDDGMRDYAENQQIKDERAFKGMDTQSGGGGGFTFGTSLPNVLYSDVEQNRSAPYTLISEVYSHFITIQERLNTQAFIHALTQLDLKDDVPRMVFNVKPKSAHPLVKALLFLSEKEVDAGVANQRKAFKAAVVRAVEFNKKPLAEQAAIKEKNTADFKLKMANIFASLKSTNTPAGPDPRKESCVQFLRNVSAAL